MLAIFDFHGNQGALRAKEGVINVVEGKFCFSHVDINIGSSRNSKGYWRVGSVTENAELEVDLLF